MEEKRQKAPRKMTVHHILAHSYSVFLFSLFIAVVIDYFIPIRVLPKAISEPVGLALLVLGPAFIYWAQKTSASLKDVKEKLTKEHFKRGPYRFTRGPTHFGLTLLILGFGILANSLFVIAGTVVAYFVSKHIFLKEQEEMLRESYGEEYSKYQKEVGHWL